MIFQWEDFSSSICLYSTLEHKKNVKKIHSLGACVSCVGAHTHKQHTHTSWSGSHASSTRVILPSPLCTLRQSQSTFSDPSYHFVHKLSGDKSYTEKCVISWMRRIHLNSYSGCMLLNTNISVTSPAKEINSSIEGVMTHCLDEKDPRRRVPGI